MSAIRRGTPTQPPKLPRQRWPDREAAVRVWNRWLGGPCSSIPTVDCACRCPPFRQQGIKALLEQLAQVQLRREHAGAARGKHALCFERCGVSCVDAVYRGDDGVGHGGGQRHHDDQDDTFPALARCFFFWT
eukprot:3937717-Rhodomonas_salina.2